MSVRVNGPELLKTVEKTRDNRDEFEKLYEEIYTKIEEELDADFTQDGKAWTGVKADQFKKNFKAVKPDFEAAKTNIGTAATNLEGHVQTWTNFDA